MKWTSIYCVEGFGNEETKKNKSSKSLKELASSWEELKWHDYKWCYIKLDADRCSNSHSWETRKEGDAKRECSCLLTTKIWSVIFYHFFYCRYFFLACVVCACVFCFCRFYHRPNKSWGSKTTTKYIVSELFGLLNTAGWCNCWIFRWPKKTKLNQQAKAMCASLQQTTIQYTRFVCMCVCLCGINLSKFVSVHWFRFTANNFWFCHLHSKWREMCSVLSLLFLFFCCVVFFILCSSDEWDSIK